MSDCTTQKGGLGRDEAEGETIFRNCLADVSANLNRHESRQQVSQSELELGDSTIQTKV